MLPSEKELTGKEELNAFTFISDNFLELFAYKALVPLLAMDTLIEKLKGTGMYDLYMNVELPTVYTLHDMEKRGVRVDRTALEDRSCIV